MEAIATRVEAIASSSKKLLVTSPRRQLCPNMEASDRTAVSPLYVYIYIYKWEKTYRLP